MQSATPATQNDMTTCLETFEKERFCSFHIDTAMPQENQTLETRHVGAAKRAFRARPPLSLTLSTRYLNRLECDKVQRLPRKTTWQPARKPSKRRGFAASPIDTAMPQENQRLEMRHVGAAKRAFRARLPPILTLCSHKIDIFLRVFLGNSKFATSKSMFRARLPSIFNTSHKLPRLPRNPRLVATWRSPANAIRKKHATRHV